MAALRCFGFGIVFDDLGLSLRAFARRLNFAAALSF